MTEDKILLDIADIKCRLVKYNTAMELLREISFFSQGTDVEREKPIYIGDNLESQLTELRICLAELRGE